MCNVMMHVTVWTSFSHSLNYVGCRTKPSPLFPDPAARCQQHQQHTHEQTNEQANVRVRTLYMQTFLCYVYVWWWKNTRRTRHDTLHTHAHARIDSTPFAQCTGVDYAKAQYTFGLFWQEAKKWFWLMDCSNKMFSVQTADISVSFCLFPL